METSIKQAALILNNLERDLLAGQRLSAAERTAEMWLWHKDLPDKILKQFRQIRNAAALTVRNKTHLPLAAGRDRFGYYFDFTGFEKPRACFWCGAKTPFRYCCDKHGILYRKQYHWPDAQRHCLDRYKLVDGSHFCADCEFIAKAINPANFFVVHHVVPLDGEERNWNILNAPNNLTLVCKSCHGKRHTQLKYLMGKFVEIGGIPEVDPQLAFPFTEGARV